MVRNGFPAAKEAAHTGLAFPKGRKSMKSVSVLRIAGGAKLDSLGYRRAGNEGLRNAAAGISKVADKLEKLAGSPAKLSSGAEALLILLALSVRLKSCPFPEPSKAGFLAAALRPETRAGFRCDPWPLYLKDNLEGYTGSKILKEKTT
jgi:hypothetical protein